MLPRRAPESYVRAQAIDGLRKDIFVEGPQDREFILGLSPSRDGSVLIHTIDEVEISQLEGGNKGRLLALASIVYELGGGDSFLFFVDSDDGYIAGSNPGHPVVVTDFRDLESYVLDDRCASKIAIADPRWSQARIKNLLYQVENSCRDITSVRMAAEDLGLVLPFAKSRLASCVAWNNDQLFFDLNRFVTSLLQNANVSISRREEVAAVAKQKRAFVEAFESRYVMRGKDAFELLDIVLGKADSPLSAAFLWGTFEPAFVSDYPNLQRVLDFCATPRR